MGRGRKKGGKPKKQEAQHPSSTYKYDEDAEIGDSEDEEVPEDEAFNSDDERKWGSFFDKGDEADSDDEDEEVDSEDGSDDDDDDEEEDDGGQYMLNLLNNLDSSSSSKHVKKQKGSAVYEQMASVPESEFSTFIGSNKHDDSDSDADGDNGDGTGTSSGKLTLDQLMEGLQDTQGFADLQKAMGGKDKSSKGSGVQTTLAPMAKVKVNRMQRKEAYEQQSKDLSSWVKTIQTNRRAETLDFKENNGENRITVTKESLVEKFEPTTDFEQELERALKEQTEQQEKDEGHTLNGDDDDDDLGRNDMTMEEYKKRRAELAQTRALLLYQEQKHQYTKKIKSKAYRRIRKRQRERQKEKDTEAAIEDNPEVENELQEKEELARIQERLTLAHKNTSKWAKRILKRGKNVDVETRRALSAQLKRGSELRSKMLGNGDGSDDDIDSDDDEAMIARAEKTLAEIESHDTSSAIPTKNKALFALSFMKKGMEKQREKAQLEAQELLKELRGGDDSDGEDVDEADIEMKKRPKKKAKVATDKEMKDVLSKGQLTTHSLEFGNSSAIMTSGGIDITGADEEVDAAKAVIAIENAGNESSVLQIESDKTGDKNLAGSQKSHSSEKKNTKKQKQKEAESVKGSVSELNSGDGEEANPWMTPKDPVRGGSGSTPSKKKNNPKSAEIANDSTIQENAALLLGDSSKSKLARTTVQPERTKPDDESDTNDGGVDNNENDDHNESQQQKKNKSITTMTQEELVRQAFVSASHDEVETEFEAEQEEMAARNDPTRRAVDKKDAKNNDSKGWGSWAGEGVSLPPPPPPSRRSAKQGGKRNLSSNTVESRKRKEDALRPSKPNVIVNKKRIKKLANNFMLGDVPHPYKSREEYEAAMAGGVGKEWNVSGSFKSLTRPEILKRSGKIIQPISKGLQRSKARAPAKF